VSEVIAAIALALDREMVTGDLRFREVAGIKVAGWGGGGDQIYRLRFIKLYFFARLRTLVRDNILI
jgi:hypothetical protein